MASRLTKVLVLLLAVQTVYSQLYPEDAIKWEEYSIVPEIISATPDNVIIINYDNLEVDMGNELTPTQVHDQPNITWEADEDAYYTLIMHDRDIPINLGIKEVQHWLVVNIPGNDIDEGVTLFDYFGSAPPKDSGFHRYVFLVYKQPSKLDRSKYADIEETIVTSRSQYLLKDLLSRFGLSDPPDAGNFFLAKYDNNVPMFQKERDMKFAEPEEN